MAANTYTRDTISGPVQYQRKGTQGRKSGNLDKPILVRLRKGSRAKMNVLKENLGYLYNENEFVRNAVDYYLNNVYTELLKH